jgi:hypothetical protein
MHKYVGFWGRSAPLGIQQSRQKITSLKYDRVFTSTNARYTCKIEKVSVCETSHHGEVGDENENPTFVALCTSSRGMYLSK